MSSYEDRKREAEIKAEAARKNPVRGRTWTPHWSHYWEPPEGSTYGSDPYLCSTCADRDAKEVPADIRIVDISGQIHAGTEAIMAKTESGWEMTEPIQKYTIAEIEDEARKGYTATGYCKDCWIAQGNYGALEVMNKKLFGAEDLEDKWSRNAAVIIDNSGSTSQKSGITHKESGHAMTVLDRHIMTAAYYLANFPKQGNYLIITPYHTARYFDNTDDAIEYLFTLRPGGGGFMRHDFKSKIAELTKAYNNVLLLMDESIFKILG